MPNWTNNSGATYEIKPTPPWLPQVITNKAPKIAPPTYQVPIVGGGMQDEPFTKQSLEQIGTEQDKVDFANYEAEQNKINQRVFDEIIDKTIEMGLVDPNPSAEFAEQVRFIDPAITDEALKRMYLFGEVAPTIEEKLALYIAISEISHNHESMEVALQSVREMFHQFHDQKREIVIRANEGQIRPMVGANSRNGTTSDEGLGDNNEGRMVQLSGLGTG